MSDRTRRWTLALVVGVYLVLGFAYSIVNPIFEGPDELLNYENLRFFAEERRLPVLREGELSKGHQAPLYYALGAVLTGWVPDRQLEAITSQGNPFWAYRHWLPGDDNKAQYLHDPALEGWPYRDVSLGVHLMRWISLLMGAGVVVTVYAIARDLFAEEGWLAPCVAALVAFNPMFIYIQSSVHNDALTNLFAALLVLGVVRYWLRGPSTPRAAGLGLLCGLGIMTKITFLFLLPMVAAAMVWRGLQDRGAGRRWLIDLIRLALIVGGITLLLSGWWFARNQLIYGEPTSMGLQSQVWGIRQGAPNVPAAVRELGFLFNSFWGAFGFGQMPMPRWVYTLLAALEWVAVGGLALWLVRSWRKGWVYRVPAALMGALAIAPLTAFAATFGRMTLSPTAYFGRYLFTTLGVIVPFLALGLTEWFPRRWRRAVLAFGALALLVLAAGVLVVVIGRAFRSGTRITSGEASYTVWHRLDWKFEDKVTLLGYNLSPEVATAGQDVTVTFYWSPLHDIEKNYTVFVHLLGEEDRTVGSRDTYPGLGRDPTIHWTPGQVVVDAIPVPVAAGARGPILLDIEAGLYDMEKDERLEIRDATGNAVGYPVVGTVKLSGSPQDKPAPSRVLDARFENGLILKGYDLSTAVPNPGSQLTVTLYWVPAGPLPADYTTFIHLVDDQGGIVAQGDSPPRGGRYPTSAWAAGEQFDDAYTITLPEDLHPGDYHLLVGLYTPHDFARLSLNGGGDHVRLEYVVSVP
ncbi:ArnT family glycosyltransferase [Chloroflexota bacterium]